MHKIYRIVPDEDAAQDGDIRMIDESGEEYLYPADWFTFVKLPQALQDSILRAANEPPNKVVRAVRFLVDVATLVEWQTSESK